MVAIPKVVQAGLQSGTIMLVADASTQFLLEGKDVSNKDHDKYDARRTLRWASAGLLLHGPYFYMCFSKLDQWVGTTPSVATVAKKTIMAQLLVFPPYLCGLFGYLGFLEGRTDIPQHIYQRVPDAFLGGCVFWPIANIVNFSLVPATLRVPYLAGVGSVWNTFLSWLNAHKDAKEP